MARFILFCTNPEDFSELCSFLKKDGYRFIHTQNLLEAFDHIKSGKIDLVLFRAKGQLRKVIESFSVFKSRFGSSSLNFFLIVPRDLGKEELIVYFQIGFDNLIFLPFDPESFRAKIRDLNQKKVAFDLFESEDFCDWVLSTDYPVALLKKGSIFHASKSFFVAIDIHPGSLRFDFFDWIDKLATETHKFELTRISNQLTQSIILKDLNISPIKSLVIRLFKGKFSLEDSFIVEVVEQVTIGQSIDLGAMNKSFFSLFTPREKEVLVLSKKGLLMKEIADQLSLSIRTVERHRSSILKKTDSSNFLEALSKLNS